MKVVLWMVGVLALFLVGVVVHDANWDWHPAPPAPHRAEQPMNPVVAESYRNDKETYEKFRQEQDRQKRIMQRAYEECREQKLSEVAVARCVNDKTN